MAQSAAHTRKILFVDDNEAFLETIQLVLATTDLKWQAFFATSASKALAIVQGQDINLAVLDLEMPEVDGLQLLKLMHRRFPGLQKAILSGSLTDDLRADCLNSGAELAFEKPREVETLKGILNTLNELVSMQPEEGFRGVLRQVGLTDIIQLECLSRHSLILEVNTGEGKGQIFIKDGAIVHSSMEELNGEPALYRILGFARGEFSFKPFAEPPAQTIEGQWEFILMEAARVCDENNEKQAELDHAGTGQLEVPVESVLAQPETIADKAITQVQETVWEPLDGPVPKIEEVLVCTNKGLVMHDWKCADTNARITLLEFISQKSALLAQGLPIGKFDRLEMQCAHERIVLQIQDECGILVRSNQPNKLTNS